MLYQTINPHGGDVYEAPVRMDFSANTNPYGTPHGVLDAIRQALPQLHHYPDPYCRALVQAIAEFEHIPQEYILCGNGAAELIYSFCEAAHPQTAVELAPTFAEYALGAARAGCRMKRYVLQSENDFEVTADFLSCLQTEAPDAVFLCNPNNPTGRTIAPALLRQLLTLCAAQNTRLFLDECFLDLTENGTSMKDALSAYPQLFILKAFTKSYGMAGVRLGYGMSADAALLQTMSECVQPWNVSTVAQAAGVAALKEQTFLQSARTTIFAEKRWLTAALQHLGCTVCPGEANYLLFHTASGLDIALKRQQIAIRSCANYEGLEAGWYRIAVRLHHENEALIHAIGSILKR